MLGYIVVVDSPFYGVTNNQGQIELTPDHGEFKLNVWHEGFSDISQTESKTIALTSAAIVYQIEQSIVPRITIGVDDYE
jgi:hypothetical protein